MSRATSSNLHAMRPFSATGSEDGLSTQRKIFRQCISNIPKPEMTLTSSVVFYKDLERRCKTAGTEDLSPIKEDAGAVCSLLEELKDAKRIIERTRAKRSELQMASYQDYMSDNKEVLALLWIGMTGCFSVSLHPLCMLGLIPGVFAYRKHTEVIRKRQRDGKVVSKIDEILKEQEAVVAQIFNTILAVRERTDGMPKFEYGDEIEEKRREAEARKEEIDEAASGYIH